MIIPKYYLLREETIKKIGNKCQVWFYMEQEAKRHKGPNPRTKIVYADVLFAILAFVPRK